MTLPKKGKSKNVLKIGDDVQVFVHTRITDYHIQSHSYTLVDHKPTDLQNIHTFKYPAYGALFKKAFPIIEYEIPPTWTNLGWQKIEGEDEKEEYRFNKAPNFSKTGEIFWEARYDKKNNFYGTVPPKYYDRGDARVEIGVDIHGKCITGKILRILLWETEAKVTYLPEINLNFLSYGYNQFDHGTIKGAEEKIEFLIQDARGVEFWVPFFFIGPI